MEHGHFDALTRTVGDVGTRRAILGLLAAGALGSVTTRLGLEASADARGRKPSRQSTKKRPSRSEQDDAGRLQAERKRKKKRPKKPPVVPDEACSLDTYRCPDGTCMPWDQCCAGEKRCHNSSGRRCVPSDQCCPDERTCPDNSCAAPGECCPTERKCDDGECHPWDGCCPGRKRCGDGTCVPTDHCCPDAIPPLCSECDDIVCVNGQYACVPKAANCGHCEQALCVDGEYVCVSNRPDCGRCKSARCHEGSWSCQIDPSACPACPADTVSCPGMLYYGFDAPCCWKHYYGTHFGRPVCTGGSLYFCDYDGTNPP